MKHKRFKLSVVFLTGLGLTGLQAQESVNTTGGNASGGGGSVSYSVGQVVYTTNNGTNGSTAQGVQQPYEISIISGIEIQEIDLSYKVYPNPTTENLILKIDGNAVETQCIASLISPTGQQLKNINITASETIIPMEQFPAQTYILQVIKNNQILKTFKIVKQ